MPEPQTSAEWEALADQKLVAAQRLHAAGGAPSEVHDLAGHAVECALKAYIMRRLGLASPPKKKDPIYRKFRGAIADLIDLAELVADGLVDFNDTESDIAASLAVTRSWSHNAKYHLAVKQKRADDMLEAAGSNNRGVIPWLRTC